MASNNRTVHHDDDERQSVRNFLYFCAVASVASGCAVSCLALSSAVLEGEQLRAAEPSSALLFGSYTLSALLVAAPVTRSLGPKRAVTSGMVLLCLYVLSFVVATFVVDVPYENLAPPPGADRSRQVLASIALCTGAILGGIGAGILWTAVGVYLALASSSGQPLRVGDVDANDSRDETPVGKLDENKMAAWLASIYLIEETLLEAMSAVLVRRFEWRWTAVFGVYLSLSVVATASMRWVREYSPVDDGETTGDIDTDEFVNGRCASGNVQESSPSSPTNPTTSPRLPRGCDKVTLATRQLLTDPKAKYLVGLPLAFGFAGGFFVSFVSGQVVPAAMYSAVTTAAASNSNTTMGSVNGALVDSLTVSGEMGASEAWVGTLTAIHGLVAAIVSLSVGYSIDRCKRPDAQQVGTSSRQLDSNSQGRHVRTLHPKRPVSIGSVAVLVGGSLALVGVGAAILVWPGAQQWTLAGLVGLYAVQGVARAVYEGPVKAIHVRLYGSQPAAMEGAFALVVLFNGIGSVASYIVSLRWTCPTHPEDDPYCVEYRDGSRHNVKAFALCVVGISTAAALGYVRVWFLVQKLEGNREADFVVEQDADDDSSTSPFWRRRRSYQTVRSAERAGDNGSGTELRELT